MLECQVDEAHSYLRPANPQLRLHSNDLFIESLPAKAEFEALLGPLGLKVAAYRDESKLYLMVAEKIV